MPRHATGEPRRLSNAEITRYSRHLLLPEVGFEGQQRLVRARVVCVGIGGLGSPAALYLAAAGVGTLGIVDLDRVEPANLQRQVLYTSADIGRPKIEAASDRLAALNPGIDIVTHQGPLTAANAEAILGGYDLVVDATDNFPARYLVNDACVLAGRPYVYGSASRFEGQVSVLAAPGGPCYRCLYPEPPPPGAVPSCVEEGVLGVVPGIVGTIQAAEAIKLLTGAGVTLAGRLLVIDALAMRFREVRLAADPACPVCGPRATIRQLVDYEAFCGFRGTDPITHVPIGVPEMSAEQLARRLGGEDPPVVIDVREPAERAINLIEGSMSIPASELGARSGELPRDRDLVVACRGGERSGRAAADLLRAGLTRVWSLAGGMNAWVERVDPSQPQY